MDYSINNKPLVINWMISGKCNMFCKFCFGQFDSQQMSKDRKLFILGQIAKHGIPKLTLTGGEPLLDEDIIEILEKAHSLGIFTSLHTNGLLLTEELIQELKPFIGRISLPLDGSTNEINQLMRNEKNFFSRIFRIIEILKREKISFSIKSVASKKNIDDFDKMIPIMIDINPVVWLISEFRSLRRGSLFQNEYKLDDGMFKTLQLKLEKIPLNTCLFSNDNESNHPHFFIHPNGKVYTNDIKSDYHVGSMFSDSIPNLWSNILKKNSLSQSYLNHSRIRVHESHPK